MARKSANEKHFQHQMGNPDCTLHHNIFINKEMPPKDSASKEISSQRSEYYRIPHESLKNTSATHDTEGRDFPLFNQAPADSVSSTISEKEIKETDRKDNYKSPYRVTFTAQQLAALHQRFRFQKYLSPLQMQELSDKIGITPKQVKTWFQNRRMKLKRYQKDQSWFEKEHMLQAGPQGSHYVKHFSDKNEIQSSAQHCENPYYPVGMPCHTTSSERHLAAPSHVTHHLTMRGSSPPHFTHPHPIRRSVPSHVNHHHTMRGSQATNPDYFLPTDFDFTMRFPVDSNMKPTGDSCGYSVPPVGFYSMVNQFPGVHLPAHTP